MDRVEFFVALVTVCVIILLALFCLFLVTLPAGCVR